MNKLLKSITGLFLIVGKGFNGTAQTATRFTPEGATDAQECASNLGVQTTIVDAPASSFAVVYIRKGDVTADGKVQKKTANVNLGEVDPSKRRFATEDEAIQHGSRFKARRANRVDQPGTAGHRGFFVVETSDPVNAAVNWKTGLTNSI